MLTSLLSSNSTPCDDSYSRLCGWLDSHDSTGALAHLVQFVIVPLVVLVIVVLLGRLVRALTERGLRDWGADPQIRTLLHNVLTGAYWVLAFFAAFVKAGLNLNVLLTFGGVASLAVGLAFQDLLRNVLAGIFLLVERPFRIGDMITVADCTGVVQTISLRTTSLRLGDGRIAVLPNLSAFNGTIVNSSASDVRRYTVRGKVPDGASLETLMRRLRQELRAVPGVVREPEPSVVPHVDADGTTVECRYYVDYRASDTDTVGAQVTQRVHRVLNEPPAAAAAS